MTDETKIWCSEVLNLLSIYAVLSRSPYGSIVALRTIQLCIKYGLSRGSSWAFAFYGMIAIGEGNMKEGARMAQVSLAVLEASGAHEMLPRVYAIVYSGIHQWNHPLRETLEPLKFAACVGMEIGDLEHAMLCVNRYCVHRYFSGDHLVALEEDFIDYARQMKAFKQENCLISFKLIGQLIHNLTGRAKEPSVLKGEIMDIDLALKEAREMHAAVFEMSCIQFSAYVAYLFGDYERANELEEKIAHGSSAISCFWGKVQVCFTRGLAAIALARTNATRRKKLLSTGKASCKEMSTWAKICPSNFAHKQKLLEAELAGTMHDAFPSSVMTLYDKAVEGARREGIVHEEALACERAAEYMERVGDSKTALAYRQRASLVYSEWGATAKASMLEVDAPDALEA